jgi:hypothetical protein
VFIRFLHVPVALLFVGAPNFGLGQPGDARREADEIMS